MKLAFAVSFVMLLAAAACADPGANAGPPRTPDDAPTVNDPDTTASAAGMSAQPKSDAGVLSGCGASGC